MFVLVRRSLSLRNAARSWGIFSRHITATRFVISARQKLFGNQLVQLYC
jgi:hypothetical protein